MLLLLLLVVVVSGPDAVLLLFLHPVARPLSGTMAYSPAATHQGG